MRNWSAYLIENLSGDEVTRCFLIEMNSPVLDIVRLTNFDADLLVGANTFSKSSGFNVTRSTVKNGGDPAALDIEIPLSDDGPVYADHVRRGAWRGATAVVWICDPNDPSDREIVIQGFVGLTEFTDRLKGRFEIVTLADALKDIILPTLQPKCELVYCGDRCGVVEATFTKNATVTAVTNRRKFTATITSPGSLDFNHGKVTWLTGDNAGGKEWIRKWTSGTSLIEMVRDFPFDIQIGDTLQILDGCKQTRADCLAHDNLIRFAGFEKVLA